MSETLASSRVVVASPMSFAGAYGRTMNLFWRDRPTWAKAAIAWWAIPLMLALWWSFIIVWYILAFAVFGIFVIPWRLLRRGSRNRKRQDLQHREMMEVLQNRADN